jgi:molecular chaperone DnaK (HSP70)
MNVWIGIDLGTSNSSVAVWDSIRGHPKWIRLGYHFIAAPTNQSNHDNSDTNNNGGKDGRLVPSCILFVTPHFVQQFLSSSEQQQCTVKSNHHDKRRMESHHWCLYLVRNCWFDVTNILFGSPSSPSSSFSSASPCRAAVYAYVGYAAVQIQQALSSSLFTTNTFQSKSSRFPTNETNNISYDPADVSAAYVTGYKHWMGADQESSSSSNSSNNNKDLNHSNDNVTVMNGDVLDNGKPWRDHTCPIPVTLVDGKLCIPIIPLDASTTVEQNQHQRSHLALYIQPHQFAAITLQAIRIASNVYLTRHVLHPRGKHLQVPGSCCCSSSEDCYCSHDSGNKPHVDHRSTATISTATTTINATHVVIGVPVHYNYDQCQLIQQAARLAGFCDDCTTISNNSTGNRHGISVLHESTCAAMAYGLSLQQIKDHYHGECSNSRNNGNGCSSPQPKRTILVFDMGGGTTDITIAETNHGQKFERKTPDNSAASSAADRSTAVASMSDQLQVQVTVGKAHLGGDAMDYSLAYFVLERLGIASTSTTSVSTTSLRLPNHVMRSLLDKCKHAKEVLCNEINARDISISTTNGHVNYKSISADITFQGAKFTISMADLEQCAQPILQQTEELVKDALAQYCHQQHQQREQQQIHIDSSSVTNAIAKHAIHEVILVGGATRVPFIRSLLRKMFPPPIPPELCTSVHPMSAVATGCAIQAAIVSNLIPYHELQSAMMLDTIPHPIGILFENSGDSDDISPHDEHFVPILSQGSTLPARGIHAFQVGTIDQHGVTIKVVEKIVDSNIVSLAPMNRRDNHSKQQFSTLGVFTFLLHRLTASQRSRIMMQSQGLRFIDVYLEMTTFGALIVSIIDDNDPEHKGKRQRYLGSNTTTTQALVSTKTAMELDTDASLLSMKDDETCSLEMIGLLMVCFCLMILYFTVKVHFHALLDHIQ